MKRFLCVLAGVLAFLAVPVAVQAKVEADPNKEYVISPEAGPFVICVKPYLGSDAHADANRLTLHLRQHGWPAYVYDYTPEEKRKAKEWLDARYANVPPEARPHKTIRVEDQWGVLIGGYRDFDSASRDIPKVKQTPEPPEKRIDFIDGGTRQAYQLSTYAQCIATRNPTVRAPQADPTAADPAWKRLNEGRPYNLLKCGKPWTVAVVQFQGTGVLQPRSMASEFLSAVGLGGKSGDFLEASAAQAEEVARVLRLQKFDAYVLHTRSGSVVTVGAFDRMDDPAIQQVAHRLAGGGIGVTKDAIKFFEKPIPMKVPQL